MAREQDALELLRRLYDGDVPANRRPIYDDAMYIDWIMDEIAAFIRKHGALSETQARQ